MAVNSVDIPNELEYVSDYQAQDNFRQSFRVQLNRCLTLMIKEPVGAFELALAGLDTILDYYKDGIYLDEIDEIIEKYNTERRKLRIEKRKATGKSFEFAEENLRFNFNKERFRALMRLAGRSSFLPFPPVAVNVGGVNPDSDNIFDDSNIVSGDDVEDTNKKLDEISQDLLNMAQAAVSNLKLKDENKEALKDDSSS